MLIKLIVVSLVFAAEALTGPAAAASAAPVANGVPCTGPYKLNEVMTHRTRLAIGPFMEIFGPGGKNGWVRIDTGDLALEEFGHILELHFERFDNKPYRVFGSNPTVNQLQKLSDRIITGSRPQPDGRMGDPSFRIFSKDCKRVSFWVPEGVNYGIPYQNDVRVFDRIEPPAGVSAGPVAAEFFGGWILNRATSTMTIGHKEARTVIIIPWGNSGWVWSHLSGGAYQPEDFQKGLDKLDCEPGAACPRRPAHMMLYWATWDSKPYPTYGTRRVEVRVKRVNERTFEVATLSNRDSPVDKADVVLSSDGQRLTVTTKSGAASGSADHFADDVRIYDRIDPDKWPSATP